MGTSVSEAKLFVKNLFNILRDNACRAKNFDEGVFVANF
jgi:hypothetical protein